MSDRGNTFVVASEVLNERLRQIDSEDFSHAHDDTHVGGELGMAAICYMLHSQNLPRENLRHCALELLVNLWPWPEHWWKPRDRRRDLVKAAALILAEIERLDRVGVRNRAAAAQQFNAG